MKTAKNKRQVKEKSKKTAHPTRIFIKENDLLNAWEAFKKNLKVQAKEWVKIQYVGKDGFRVVEPQKVPYTLEGFKRYCRIHYGEVEQYFTNQGGYYSEFIGICRAIKEEIRENQIIGGLLGFHNPSITQRLNGLVDKSDMTSAGESIKPIFNIGYSDEPKDED